MFRATAAILRRPWARAAVLIALLAVHFLCQLCHAQAAGAHHGAAAPDTAAVAGPLTDGAMCVPESGHGNGAGEAHPCDTVEAASADTRAAAGKLLLFLLIGAALAAVQWTAPPGAPPPESAPYRAAGPSGVRLLRTICVQRV
ncbi:hypothetical protein [Marinactinospora rubrisoli]|uniref:Uncharacterized protein n=1 Tax=Marinactinospora rubrisoli TaxID=2715399 RepID=A0ABW2KK48_9ACTN